MAQKRGARYELAIQREATRLRLLPAAQARAVFSDRVARAFLLAGDERTYALEFNAYLATEVRRQAETLEKTTFWGAA